MEIFRSVCYVGVLSVVSIVVLFLLCKLIGQRQIGQMSMFDYINSISIGSIAAELATNLTEWEKPLTAMLIWGLITALINLLTCKSLRLRRIVAGKPVILYENGLICSANLAKAKIDINEFLTQCRVAGYFDLSQLNVVLLETNGQFSFLPLPDQRPVTPADLAQKPPAEPLWIALILDGQLQEKNLQASGHERSWLLKQLQSQNIGQISETFFAACTQDGQFFACRTQNETTQHDYFE